MGIFMRAFTLLAHRLKLAGKMGVRKPMDVVPVVAFELDIVICKRRESSLSQPRVPRGRNRKITPVLAQHSRS